MKIRVGVLSLGLTNFATALKIQNNLAESLKLQKCAWNGGILVLLEHPPVYTVGIRNKDYTKEDEQRLRSLGADFYKINRGGLITFHGPGQLIAYPIINLKHWKPSVKWYIKNLEDTIIDLCSNLSVKAHRYVPYPGIWVGENKVCAVGIHASRYVTTHGVAINCNSDLTWFDHITPCGIEGKGVTSLSKLLEKTITVEKVVPVFLESFKKYFPCELSMIDIESYKGTLTRTSK